MHNVQLSETADTSKWELRCNCGVLGKSELPCTVVCLFFFEALCMFGTASRNNLNSSNYQIGQSTWLVVIQFAHEFLSGLSFVMEVKSLGATKTTEPMHVLMHVVEVFMHTGLELHKPMQQCSKKQTEHIVSQRSCLPEVNFNARFSNMHINQRILCVLLNPEIVHSSPFSHWR